MKKVDPIITYKVWYKLNPEYEGTFQVDKIGPGGLHATIGPQHGGLPKAHSEAGRVKAWFNEEKIAVEKSHPNGKKEVSVKTVFHDNVIVWIEKYKDGYPDEEVEAKCVEVKIEAPKPSMESEVEALKAMVLELTKKLNEKDEADDEEKPKKGRKKIKEEEPEEELAGV